METVAVLLLLGGALLLASKHPPFSWPTVARDGTPPTVTSPYGWRTHPVTGERKFHNGVDLRAGVGLPLVSIGMGSVRSVGHDDVNGIFVVVDGAGDFAGWSWSYCHLSAVRVLRGDVVTSDRVIAYAGNTGRTTGPHLHLTIRKGADTVDPLSVLPTAGAVNDEPPQSNA